MSSLSWVNYEFLSKDLFDHDKRYYEKMNRHIYDFVDFIFNDWYESRYFSPFYVSSSRDSKAFSKKFKHRLRCLNLRLKKHIDPAFHQLIPSVFALENILSQGLYLRDRIQHYSCPRYREEKIKFCRIVKENLFPENVLRHFFASLDETKCAKQPYSDLGRGSCLFEASSASPEELFKRPFYIFGDADLSFSTSLANSNRLKKNSKTSDIFSKQESERRFPTYSKNRLYLLQKKRIPWE